MSAAFAAAPSGMSAHSAVGLFHHERPALDAKLDFYGQIQCKDRLIM